MTIITRYKFNNHKTTRRCFLKKTIVATTSLGLTSFAGDILSAKKTGLEKSESKTINWSQGMKPLFCTAYIDPGIDIQKNQEHFVAKYPLALVPQDDRKHFVLWRDKVRNINPDIKLLGYQMVIEETTVPGPGHDIMRALNNPWVKYPGGYIPRVTYKTAPKENPYKRIFDPRKQEWQKAFIDSCMAVLDSYPFDGLFLDQCTIYAKAAIVPATRLEMFQALDETLHKLRRSVGDKILIGNSSYNWAALNGEMNESRPTKLPKETRLTEEYFQPRLELFYYLKNINESEKVRAMLQLALNNKAFFGTSINHQTVRWHKLFDEVLSDYTIV